MTLAMYWIAAGVALVVFGLTWLLGPIGLLIGGVACVACGLYLSTPESEDST